MKQDHESSGDYGYDLAHDVPDTTSGTVTDAHRAKRPEGHPTGSDGRSDRAQDFGYDEAHDF
jgi:hypothetical protein